MIDVLRASTTIITALANGAARVRPVADVTEARACAAALGPGAVLGGERGGVRIDGFDLGNSPAEYARDRVAGRSIVITTTNGTAALATCRAAREILVGAIVNRSAVAVAARQLAMAAGGLDVHLACAGTDGMVTGEDVIAAGAILDAALRVDPAAGLDAAARAALEAFHAVGRVADPGAALAGEFRRAPGGANLVALGMEGDLPTCAALDAIAVVPRLDAASGWLTEMVPATKSG